MVTAFKDFWKNYVNFTGTATRSDYWWNVLWNFIISAVLGLLFFLSFIPQMSEIQEYGSAGSLSAFTIIMLITSILYALAIILPWWALTARRLKDAGFPWALVFINFVPYAGAIAVFILCQFPTKKVAE
jgi:uncharacterized membrane protein YhaH (DUF805 family)